MTVDKYLAKCYIGFINKPMYSKKSSKKEFESQATHNFLKTLYASFFVTSSLFGLLTDMNFNPFSPKPQIERNSWFVEQRNQGKSFNQISFDHLEKTGIRISPQRIKQIIDREIKK